MRHRLFIYGLSFLCLAACSHRKMKEPKADADTTGVHEQTTNLGNVNVADGKLVSKGVIKSVTDIALYAELQQKVVETKLQEGRRVAKGEVLLRLKDEEVRQQIQKAQYDLEQSRFRYAEILIGQGYRRSEFADVPKTIRDQAKIQCNMEAAELNLEIARKQMEKTIVKAPCSGVVTKVKVHQFDMPSNEPVCHILDPDHLMVEFFILEAELRKISKASTVSVTSVTYPNEHHVAKVTSISAMVDENGMVKIEARLSDARNLLPGMTAIVNF